MSMHSVPKINQKEYLKKYLSGDKVKKKKKDKKHKKSSTDSVKVKIIDDDINHLDVGLQIDEDLLLTGEDAPQIVGEYIEEKPADSKVPKWKSIVIKDEPDDGNEGNNHNEAEVWGNKANEMRVKQEFSFGKKHSNRTPDNSPPRRNERNRKSSSPPRRRRKSPSPLRKSTSHKIKTEPQSPPCQKRYHANSNDSLDASPLRRRNNDQSPTRRGESSYRNDHKQFSELSPNDRSRNRHQSPPRKVESSSRNSKNHSSHQLSTRHRKDSDQSPPRRDKNRNQSPPRRRKNVHHSPSEKRKSPIRNVRKKSPSLSPKRRRRDSDQSPPRRNRRSDNSPTQHKRDSDQSPPRKGQGRRDPDQLPPRKIRNSFDESPPRNSRSSSYRQERQTSDYCPPGKNRRSPNHSLPERKRQSPINNSPSRIKREKRTPDLSPQRRHSRWEKQESEKSVSPPPTHKAKPVKTLEGKKAGLQDAKSLQEETLKRRKQEDLLFEKMSTNVSGRNAEIQVRSTGRKGRRAREAREEDPEERRRKEAHEEKKKLLYDRWGKGLKQLEDHKNRMLEHEYESNKPLARYSNDEDLERHLKERERADDPMLEYMRQKRKDNEKLSGKPQIPRYEGAYPENRFGIRPGYRWDGVDRSNGFEKKYFAAQSEEHARQDEAYKYSVEDM